MNQLENENRRSSSGGRSRSRDSDRGTYSTSRNGARSSSGSGRSSSGTYGRTNTGRSSQSGRNGTRPPRRNNSHHRRKGPDYRIIAIVGVILLILITCVVFMVKAARKTGAADPESTAVETTAMMKEVTVDGVKITGMSKEQARQEILGKYPWAMKVIYGDESYEVTDLMADKVDALLTEIYSGVPEETYSLDTTGLEEAAAREAAAAAAKWDKKAKNGSIDSYDKETDSFIFAGEQAGFAIDQQKLAADILKAVSDKRFDAQIQASGSQVQPEITKATAKEKYKTLSSITTNTTANKDRNTNVNLSAEAVNGAIVQPGEEFSFNDRVGQRTEAKGYKGAAAYNNGEVVQEIGGGVCQTSTTLYNAVFRAGMEISYRRSHTFEPSYITPGQDATVSWEQPDFKFINNSKAAIGLKANYSKQKLTVSVYGIPVLEDGEKWDLRSERVEVLDPPAPTYEEDQTLEIGVEKVKKAGTQGSRWITYKVVTKDGKKVSEEIDHKTTYKGHAPVILRNTSGVVLPPDETTVADTTAVPTVDGMPDGYVPGESVPGEEGNGGESQGPGAQQTEPVTEAVPNPGPSSGPAGPAGSKSPAAPAGPVGTGAAGGSAGPTGSGGPTGSAGPSSSDQSQQKSGIPTIPPMNPNP